MVKLSCILALNSQHGEKPGSCIHQWMVSLEGQIICKGIQPAFLSALLNVEYQAEARCTIEFIQRHFLGINPESGTKAGRVLSKRTGKVTYKKTSVNHRNSS